MHGRKGFFDSPDTAELVSAVRAQQLLEHAKPYRNKQKRESFIDSVRRAIEPFCHVATPPDLSAPVGKCENPMLRFAPGPSLGLANGFLIALEVGDPALLAATKIHGLYFSGMAALSLTKPGDSINEITILKGIIEKWESDRVSSKNIRAASQPRSPFTELAREVIQSRENQFLKTKELWEKLKGERQVFYRNANYSIEVSERDDCLYWLAYDYDGNPEGEEVPFLEGSIKWSSFPKFVSTNR